MRFRKRKMNGSAEPFYYEGGKTGILLLHGFTSTPQELQLTGKYFVDRGFTVYCPLLSGHGTNKRDMQKRKWQEWAQDAQEGYDLLKDTCDQIFVLGSSYGSILAMYLAAHNKVKGVICVGPPMRLHMPDPLVDLILPFAAKFVGYVRKPVAGDIKDRRALRKRVAYMQIPLKAFSQMRDHVKIVEKMLKDFETPIIILQSKKDHAIHPRSAKIIYNNVASKIKSLRFYKDSYHLIIEDYEKEKALNQINNFIYKVQMKNEIRLTPSHKIF